MTLSRLFAVNPVEGERLAARFRDWWDGLGDTIEIGYTDETQQGLADMGYTPIDMRNLASSGVTEEEAVELIRVWHEGWYEEDSKTYLTPALDLVYYANDVTALYTNVLSSDSLYGYSDISYVYGNEQLSSEYRGDIRTNLYDGRGSVVQNLTNSSISKNYAYDPYGVVLSEVEDLYKPFYGYNGEEYNPLTELQYLRARYYSPNEGRFTSADTYWGRMDNILSQHRYTYTHNNPVNYKDPSGHVVKANTMMQDGVGVYKAPKVPVFPSGRGHNIPINDFPTYNPPKVPANSPAPAAANGPTTVVPPRAEVQSASIFNIFKRQGCSENRSKIGDWWNKNGGTLLKGVGLVLLGALAVTVAIVAAPAFIAAVSTTAALMGGTLLGAGTMTAFAAIGSVAAGLFASTVVVAGATTAIAGLSTIGEAATGTNVMRNVMGTQAYNNTVSTASFISAIGTAILGPFAIAALNTPTNSDASDDPPSWVKALEEDMAESPTPGSLSNVEARQWYLDQEAQISDLIDSTQPLDQQAQQAFNLRNLYRTQARELMADRSLAETLYQTDPNMTWEQVVAKYTDLGFSGDALWQEIINAATRSREIVNQALGL